MWPLDKLVEGLEIDCIAGPRGGELSITDVIDDSRQAGPGCLFVARRGAAADGRAFVQDAIGAGAAAILTDTAIVVPDGVALLRSSHVATSMARLAERFHGQPSSKLTLIGITGTNGKTTTAHLVQQILRPGRRCGLIGTVLVDDGIESAPATLTTPGAIETSRLLARMVERGCEACVMEVSSHALHQGRVDALAFDVGVFTNLSGDHLDYHETVQEYVRTKAKLFALLKRGGTAIVNADDPQHISMMAATRAGVLRCSIRDASAECFACIREMTIDGANVEIRGPWGAVSVLLPLIGEHNVANALQAAAAAHAAGCTASQIQASLATADAPPGRLESVSDSSHAFTVLVDYAHTDDALDNVLRTLRPLVPDHGRLRVVFGCGGDRDRTKRPRMAAVAWRYADDVVVTSDNPRTEDPNAIIQDILRGVPSGRISATRCLVDRREAIHEVIRDAQRGDVVLIAGKGHEDYQIVGTERRAFDDRIMARAALAAVAEGVAA